MRVAERIVRLKAWNTPRRSSLPHARGVAHMTCVLDLEDIAIEIGNPLPSAVLAVMAAIALLAVTLVVPRKSLLLIEPPAAYADAS